MSLCTLMNHDNLFWHRNPIMALELSMFDEIKFQVSRDPLNYTNTSWFRNLSNTHIPIQVSNLLQFGDKFSLPTQNNKKRAIHEIIKDVESNIKNSHIENQIRI